MANTIWLELKATFIPIVAKVEYWSLQYDMNSYFVAEVFTNWR